MKSTRTRVSEGFLHFLILPLNMISRNLTQNWVGSEWGPSFSEVREAHNLLLATLGFLGAEDPFPKAPSAGRPRDEHCC